MTHAIEEFGPDLTEAIPETFDVCEDCGTPTIQLSSHTCPDPETVADPTREELDRRTERDPFPASDTVLVRTTNRTNTYAYHETDHDGTPLCPVDHDDLTGLARADAQDQRYAPCQFCQRIRRANEEVTDR